MHMEIVFIQGSSATFFTLKHKWSPEKISWIWHTDDRDLNVIKLLITGSQRCAGKMNTYKICSIIMKLHFKQLIKIPEYKCICANFFTHKKQNNYSCSWLLKIVLFLASEKQWTFKGPKKCLYFFLWSDPRSFKFAKPAAHLLRQ